MTPVVVDASGVVEFLRATAAGSRIAARINQPGVRLHIPHLCVIEVANAFRGLVLGGRATAGDARQSLEDLTRFRARRHRAEAHLARMWELRGNLNLYDAAYIALADSLDATLVTSDGKLDTATVRRLITVEVIR